MSLALTLAAQIALPRLLLAHGGDAGYVAYVAVVSTMAYVSLADGGILVAVSRNLAEAHGRGDLAAFRGEGQRARRLFAVTGLVGIAIAIALGGTAISTAQQQFGGELPPLFLPAVAAELAAVCIGLGVANFHTAVAEATNRLIVAQYGHMATQMTPLLGLLIAIWLTRRVEVGLLTHAAITISVNAVRGVHAVAIFRRETRGVVATPPDTKVGFVLTSGLAVQLSEALPSATFPHLLTVLAPQVVAGAIPGRTYANSTRIIGRQFISLLTAQITRMMAGPAETKRRAAEVYRHAAAFLTGLQLLLVGLIAVVAPPVFALWLPAQASRIVHYLPGLLAQQALLAAAMPSSILFVAASRLRLMGVVRLTGLGLGIPTLLLTYERLPELSFGLALAAAAIPHFLLGASVEARSSPGFPPPNFTSRVRYLCALACAVACSTIGEGPWVLGGASVIAAALLLPRSSLFILRYLVSGSKEPARS
ncbi:MAG: hypothetical protein AAGA56_02360 [Myxococcota bacterium]